MKPLHLIIILLINNLILLYFVGYFEDQSTTSVGVSADAGAPIVAEVELEAQLPPESLESVDESSRVVTNQLIQQSGDEAFVESFQRVATTGAFTDIMDRWQMEAQKRYQEFSRNLAGKSDDELYELALNSESLYEQRTVLQKLKESGMSKLSVAQLKALYRNENAVTWSKSHILSALLDKNDAETMELAKQELQKDPNNTVMGVNLLKRIYENDPKFVARFIEGVGLDSRYAAHSVVSLLLSEPELAESYMSKHFGQLLESDNRWMHELRLAHVDFKLSDGHQERLVAMMSDESRQKRQFAMGFAHRINDTGALRTAFGTLINDREKRQFLMSLVKRNPTVEHKQLARQLATEMNDPEILRRLQ